MVTFQISKFKLLCLLLYIVAVVPVDGGLRAEERVTYLEPNVVIDYEPSKQSRGFFERNLLTYCYGGTTKTLKRLFETIEVFFDIEGEDFTQYKGSTPEDVEKHYEEHRSLFSLNLFSQKSTRVQLPPFTQQCIGMDSGEKYRVVLKQQCVDVWRFIQLISALLLFSYAGKLSHNTIFYYITGIALGICLSFMLLIWLTSKLIPRRLVMYGTLLSGWVIGLYFIQMIWENLQVIVLTYRTYVIWYIVTTGLISFFVCYHWGPPKTKRSRNIIKWLLQLVSLALIYFSSHYEEATVSIMIIIGTINYFPKSIYYKLRSWYIHRHPPKRRLLTNEEYYEQGVRETTKALEELRSYARSPDCKQWRVMAQLSDPFRFAAFVEGASHLKDEEILHFENFGNESDNTGTSELATDEDEPSTSNRGLHLNNRVSYDQASFQSPYTRLNIKQEESHLSHNRTNALYMPTMTQTESIQSHIGERSLSQTRNVLPRRSITTRRRGIIPNRSLELKDSSDED